MTNSYGVVVLMYHGDYTDDWDTHISDVRELLIPLENFNKAIGEFDTRSNELYKERYEALTPYRDYQSRDGKTHWKRGNKEEGERIEAEYKEKNAILEKEYKDYIYKWTTMIYYAEVRDEL